MESRPVRPTTPQTPTPQPSPPEIPSIPPTKNISKPLVVALVLLFLVATGAAGYFVYQNYQPKKQTLQPKSSLSPIATTIPTTSPIPGSPASTPDPTAGWKTYSGANSLTFKYPADYTLKATTDSINVQKNPTRALIYISLMNNPQSLSAQQWFDSLPTQFNQQITSIHSRSTTTIDGQMALKFVKQDGSQDFLIILTHGTKGYFVYFGPSATELTTANQILSTFKFLNDPMTSVSGDISQNKNLCNEGFIYSQKECRCVKDIYGCKGLNKEDCQLNLSCFSFSRGGSCSCPNCDIFLKHQCLPKT